MKKARTIIDHGTDEDKQDVEEGNKSLNQVAGEIRARRKQEEPPVITEQPIVQPASPPVGGMIGDTDELLAAGKKFGTFYISIPWDKYVPPGVNVKGNGEDVWTQKRLAHLPVDELAAAKSHVHIWVPSQFIKVAILLLEGWRFEYKGLFLCTRPPKKRGAFWRENHDFLLLGVRGRLKFQGDFETNLLATADSGNGKPEQVRNLIESVSPPPRIEFFASETVEGWTTWRPTGS